MEPYVFKKNLHCIVMAFYRPQFVLDFFLKDISFCYSAVPLIVFTVYYEILYVLDYLFKDADFVHILADIMQIPDAQYNFYQIFLFPAVHIADLFVFGGAIYVISKILHLHKIGTVKVFLFFVFIFNTIGLVSAVTDTLSFVWESEFFIYVHPVTGVVFLGYLTEFIRRQAETSRQKSFILSISSLVVKLVFRVVFLG